MGCWHVCACVLSLFSWVQLFDTLWTVAYQAPLSMGFSRQEYWRGLPCPPPGDLPNPRTEPTSPAFPALAGRFFTAEPPGKPKFTLSPNKIWHIKFSVHLYIIARTWKQPRCPSADKWIRKLWYIYTMEYYSAIKNNTFESVLMIWIKLEPIIQSEVSQKDRHQYSILTHTYGIWKMVMITLYVRQKKRHRYIEQTFGLWEMARVGCSERITLKHVYYQEWNSQPRLDAWDIC